MYRLISFILILVSLETFGQTAKPSVAAGNNQTITLPTSSVSLAGKACDADGTISTYRWSGGVGTITSPNSASTTVTGLTAAGNYVFKLKATDNSGLTDSSSMTVIVNPALPPTNNSSPRSYAGNDVTINLPTSSVSLIGKGTDADGSVVAYLWSKEVGSGGSFSNANAATTTFSGLSAGEYRLRLTVTDNNGATGSDTVHITVKGANPPPPPPPGEDTADIPAGFSLVYSNNISSLKDCDPFGHDQIGSGSFSTSLFYSSPGSFKSVPANVSAGIRSEIQFDEGQTPLDAVYDYYAYYETVFSSSGHSFQLHPSTSGGSGTGLYHVNGKFDFVSVESGTTGTHYATGYTIPKNKWIHIRLYIKWGSSGAVKLIIDGVTLLDRTNVKIGDGSRPYLKLGVNMWVNQASVVYYDQLRVFKRN